MKNDAQKMEEKEKRGKLMERKQFYFPLRDN
jgi:hypothetical protein